jgi:hypothetical protein
MKACDRSLFLQELDKVIQFVQRKHPVGSTPRPADADGDKTRTKCATGNQRFQIMISSR